MNKIEFVVLVDEEDEEVGAMEKLAAHERGVLHRAFSVFIFNSKPGQEREMLLQRRAAAKYHSGGLWTNACCGHPRPGEDTKAGAERRLFEEMRIKCPLSEEFAFVYRTDFENGLIEHEFDHVFAGVFDGDPLPDPAEAEGWKWINRSELEKEIAEQPELFTHWFKLAYKRAFDATR